MISAASKTQLVDVNYMIKSEEQAAADAHKMAALLRVSNVRSFLQTAYSFKGCKELCKELCCRGRALQGGNTVLCPNMSGLYWLT